ncbi:MAG: TrkH family potassium uptake protein [Thermoleophilia bacterium]|nr:TrkH family potassium uptake protein [Thermoleophilia bacterium]
MLAFAAAILAGTGLLMLPAAKTGAGHASFMEALFTSTSAVCVTGHSVVDTATYWTVFGQAVIMLLVQLGGLGIMSAALVVFMLAGRRMGLRRRMIAAEEAGVVNLSDVRRILLGLIAFSLTCEAVIAVALAARFSEDASLGTAVWRGAFHAVSSFNNAGFALFSDNLVGFASDWFVIMPIALGIIVGGIGYPVFLDLRKNPRRAARWTLHTKLTLTATGILLFGATLAFLVMEFGNPATLEPLDGHAKVLSAFFQSVTTRTAGFNSISQSGLHDESLLVSDMLMFVGGGSGSTAGGVKVVTFAVLLLMVIGEARGGRQAEAFGRTLPTAVLRQSLAIAFLAINAVTFGTIALLAATPYSLSQCLFEVTSAFGTVGLSTGITADLGDFGQSVLVALMYLGRVGPLTLAVALAARERDRLFTFPEERPLVG